ncbi:hypothetical protein DITRI_Ditri12bG0063900 [Diplodiscus trichospermus]
MVVTVRCGHCTTLLSVNMVKASFVPFQLLASLDHDDEPKEGAVSEEVGAPRKTSDRRSPSLLTSNSDNEEEEDIVRVNPTVNKPPEKRQRAPSAYNRFIKEEIRRLKAQNPNIPHKEAFSTAAKNVSGLTFLPCTAKETERAVARMRDQTSWNSVVTDQFITNQRLPISKAIKYRPQFTLREHKPGGDIKRNETLETDNWSSRRFLFSLY